MAFSISGNFHILAFVIFLWHASISSTNGEDLELSRNKRILLKNESKHWVNGKVPYIRDPRLTRLERKAIEDTILLLIKYTPIRLIPHKGDRTFENHGLIKGGYIYFEHSTGTCDAGVGFSATNRTVHCCEHVFTCLHEIGHALGFHHEQVSYKRDKWISMIPGSVDATTYNTNYKKTSKDEFYDLPYDPYSIMHYRPSLNTFKFTFPELKKDWQKNNFYFFKEMCYGYKCHTFHPCDQNNLPKCVNDGFVTVMDDYRRCACMCPEGLDPATNCATPLNKNCGGIITLNSTVREAQISYDRRTQHSNDCYWFIKGDPNVAGNLLLNFGAMNVQTSRWSNHCEDEVWASFTSLGHQGNKFCGTEVKHTIQSIYKDMRIRFKTTANSKSHFRATVTWKPAAELCHGPNDVTGVTYDGDVDYTRDFKQCMPWRSVNSKCDYYPFKRGNFFFNLKDNKCRNPDNSFRPWCYVDAINCERRYCDVCSIERPYDKDSEAACRRSGCRSGSPSTLNCARSCRVQKTIDPQRRCVPQKLTDSRLQWPKASYKVGETAVYECNTDPSSTVKLSCRPDGSWSEGSTACLACPIGWMLFEGRCYHYESGALFYNNAKAHCEQMGAVMAPIRNKEIQRFISKLRSQKGVEKLWLPLENRNSKFQWADGSSYVYKNWGRGEPSQKNRPVFMESDGHWSTLYWEEKPENFVCEKKTNDNMDTCKDFLSNCNTYQRFTTCEHSGSMRNLCQRTCGECPRRCPPGSQTFGEKCYQYMPKALKWVQAYDDCHKLPGGILATSKSQQENAFLRGLAGSGRVRIGAYYVYGPVEGWKWGDNSYVQWSNWSRSARAKVKVPRHNPYRSAVLLKDGTWDMSNVDEVLPYICVFNK